MTTKAEFITAMGGALRPVGDPLQYVRTSGNVLTRAGHNYRTGVGPFKVMGTDNDPPAGLSHARYASALYLASGAELANETITIDGVVYTFKATAAADGDVAVNAGAAAVALNLARAINASIESGGGNGFTYTPHPTVKALATNTICVALAKTLDADIGNAIVVSEAAAGDWNGAPGTLENGLTGTDYYIVRLTDDTFSLATSKANALAGVVVTLTDAGLGTQYLIKTWETIAETLDECIGYLTANGVRVQDAAFNTKKFWMSAIDGTLLGDPS